MDLEQLEQKAKESISSVKEPQGLEKWRIQYLGRKSSLSLFFNSLSKLSFEERKKQGEKANKIRNLLTNLYTDKKTELEKDVFASKKGSSSFLDITQPGYKKNQGHLHPLTLVYRDIIASFERLGFSIIEGPEIETEYYNFDALNIPPDHPAREMWDTLWIKQNTKTQKSKTLLRTHTSPMQVRYMEKNQPPFRIIVPGRCFRHEATDASHEIQFYQIEGLMVGENVNLSNLKAIISEVIKDIFKQKVSVRFRPSFFPFVAPGVEVDIKQETKGDQSIDKWLEIIGAGMVHPDLFKRVGYENNRWQGFAFGLGIERVAMIKYKINDIRLFFNPDIRFLEQF